MNRTRRLLVGLVATAMLLAAFPLAAVAQVEEERPLRETVTLSDEDRADRLRHVKERITNQIERRLSALERLAGRVGSAKYITESHAASLLADYAGAEAILVAGIDEVAAAETIEELRSVAPPIFESTLVFALLGPKTHAVIGSDAVSSVATRSDELIARLQDALDRLEATGVDVTDAVADLDEASDLVAAAARTGTPVADSVIGLQPGDDIKEPLAAAKEALREARANFGDAKALASEVVKFIRANLPDNDEAG